MKRTILIFSLIFLTIAAVSFFMFRLKTEETSSFTRQQIRIGVLSSQANTSYEIMLTEAKKRLETLSDRYEIVYLQEPNLRKETFDQAAAKYVQEEVDVIFANSTTAVLPAMKHTSNIPIVFGSTGDPVGAKIAASMDSSGNNTTGVTSLAVDLTARRLEVLKKVFPEIKKVYFIHEPGAVTSDSSKAKIEAKAKELGVTLIEKEALTAGEVKAVADTLSKKEADAIIMAASSLIWGQLPVLIEVQAREKIPVVGTDKSMIEGGAAFAYGPDYVTMGQQVGDIISLIVRGTKPSDIPIQLPQKIEFIMNMNIMRSLGLVPTQESIASADLVIE